MARISGRALQLCLGTRSRGAAPRTAAAERTCARPRFCPGLPALPSPTLRALGQSPWFTAVPLWRLWQDVQCSQRHAAGAIAASRVLGRVRPGTYRWRYGPPSGHLPSLACGVACNVFATQYPLPRSACFLSWPFMDINSVGKKVCFRGKADVREAPAKGRRGQVLSDELSRKLRPFQAARERNEGGGSVHSTQSVGVSILKKNSDPWPSVRRPKHPRVFFTPAAYFAPVGVASSSLVSRSNFLFPSPSCPGPSPRSVKTSDGFP
jgi:hypothetical protein